MPIIKSVTGFDDVGDYNGQGKLKPIHPLNSQDIRKLPEFLRALNYARAAAKAKQTLTALISKIPLTNRSTFLKELEHAMKQDSFMRTPVDVALFSESDSPGISSLAKEYLSSRKLLCHELGSFDEYTRAKVKRMILTEVERPWL